MTTTDSEPNSLVFPEGITGETLLGEMPLPVLLLSPEGRLLYLNRAAQDLLHVPAAMGQHFAELSSLSTAAQTILFEVLSSALKGEPVPPAELQITAAGPGPRTFEVHALPLARAGQVIGLQLGLCETTECRKLEEKLRLLQRMDIVGRLATGLAHDFNNILTVIKGYAEVLLLDRGLAEEALRRLRNVATAAERGASLTRQLLTFSRRKALAPKLLDLNEVLSNVAQMLRRLLSDHITLRFQYAAGLPAVEADIGIVEQVITNLVLRASDALRAGEQVVLATALETLTEASGRLPTGAKPGRYVVLSIAGPAGPPPPAGLPAAGAGTGTVAADGNDLVALETTRVLAARYQGWLETSPADEGGLGFKVYWPAAATTLDAAAVPAEAPTVQGGTETILVVEDEPAIRELARAILVGYGYTVLEAGSGPEALALWPAHAAAVDLLFTDMVMPGGLTGRMLAEELAARKPSLRVLFTTGYSLDLVDPNSPLKPGFRLLPKPYNGSALGQAVRRSLDQAAARG